MRKDFTRFEYLFKKFTEKNISDEERNEFLEMTAQEYYGRKLRKLIRTEVENTTTEHSLDDKKADELFEKIMEAKSNLAPVIPLKASIKYRLRWVAAVALVLLFSGGFFLWSQSSHETIVASNKSAAPLKNDVAPGHPGAILTLANGQKIILDSAHNGLLAVQGSSNITKNGSQVNYQQEANPANEILYNTMTTPKGRQFQLVLADGSKVWLNAASSITFPTRFDDKGRKVEISGEVYFEVKPLYNSLHKKIPFTVSIEGPTGEKREVQVLGTHFNVNAYDNESDVKTTLLEGSVRVLDNGESVTIKPGEQAILNKQQNKMKVVQADVEEAVAWKNGFFSFKNATIGAIMRQVERWYDVDVVYNHGVPAGHYAGEVPMNVNASQMLEVLRVGGIRFKIEGRMIRVM